MRFAVVLAMLAAVAWAADITGTWKGDLQGGDTSRTLVFHFKAESEKLTGTVAGLLSRELTIENGKIEGNTVSFSVMSEWQGSPVKLVYKGQVSGDEIRFTMGTEGGEWSTDVTAKKQS